MSIKDCRASRYTDPKKFSGTDSWNSNPCTMTKSPTVRFPCATPCAARSIAAERDAEKMAFCPKFNIPSELAIFKFACSTPFKLSS